MKIIETKLYQGQDGKLEGLKCDECLDKCLDIDERGLRKLCKFYKRDVQFEYCLLKEN